MGSTRKGMLNVLIAAVLWGSSGVCAQYIMEQSQMSSQFLTMTRLIFAGLILLTLSFIHGDKIFSIINNHKDAISLLIFSVVGALTVQLTFLLTIENRTQPRQRCCNSSHRLLSSPGSHWCVNPARAFWFSALFWHRWSGLFYWWHTVIRRHYRSLLPRYSGGLPRHLLLHSIPPILNADCPLWHVTGRRLEYADWRSDPAALLCQTRDKLCR